MGRSINYNWESVGNQDECIRKVCYMSPHLLEHVEEEWIRVKNSDGSTSDLLMMASRVYLWNDQDKVPEMIAELPMVEYSRGSSWACLEDWYAINVLAEEFFTGEVE